MRFPVFYELDNEYEKQYTSNYRSNEHPLNFLVVGLINKTVIPSNICFRTVYILFRFTYLDSILTETGLGY